MPKYREKSRVVEAYQLADSKTSQHFIINWLAGFGTFGPNTSVFVTIDGQKQLLTPDEFIVKYHDTGELRILTPGEFTYEFEHAL